MDSAAPLSTATSAQVYLNHSSHGGCLTSSDTVASASTKAFDPGGASAAMAVEAGGALTGTETGDTG